MSVSLLIFTGLSIVFIVAATVYHGEADRTALVQHHGITRMATLLAVKNIYHSGKSSFYTADLDMSFSPALSGQTLTVVHYPGRVQAPPGSRFQILIDPDNPGYAELPGAPATKSYAWIMFLGLAALAGVTDVFFAQELIRLWKLNRC